MDVLLIYASLFASAFLAATILPAQSELGLAALLSMGTLPTFWLIAVASIGNILGAVVNWVLGQKFEQLKSKKWFPVTTRQLERATKWFQRFGVWSLLFSWLPIIGDPITLAAGFFGVRFGLFLTLVAIAKTGRYLAIAILLFYF
ncbi:MAG: YqaA family protein [Candidatus Puniceispirillaceae bacterium]